MERRAALKLVTCLAAVTVAALAGSLSTIDTVDKYAALEQPSWAPPSWVFGPVWTVLYVAIAIAGWRLWDEGTRSPAFLAWTVQLVMNALWSPLFFAWELRGIALGWIVAMDLLVGWLVWRSWTRDQIAAYLLSPYLAWILFATALNAAVWWLNRA